MADHDDDDDVDLQWQVNEVNRLFADLWANRNITEEDTSILSSLSSDDPEVQSSMEVYEAFRKRKRDDNDQMNRQNATGDLPSSSRILPDDSFVTATLTDQIERLVLHKWQASFIANEPDFIDKECPPSYEKTILAFDEHKERFELQLSVFMDGTHHRYNITTGWDAFVNKHNLSVGDKVMFCGFKDNEVLEDDYYYVLKISRKAKAAKLTIKEDEDPMQQQPPHDEGESSKGKGKSVDMQS